MIEKVFRDPVHNYIHVDHQVIYDLINTKEFQRLRRIKQLGTSGYTFHGGEHSRFSHCLGSYEISRRITKIFDEKYPEVWDRHESLLVMANRWCNSFPVRLMWIVWIISCETPTTRALLMDNLI